MKVVRIRYGDTPAQVVADAKRFFRNEEITMASLRREGAALIEKSRYGYMKEKFDAFGNRMKILLYILVRDTFNMPLWIQGISIIESDIDDPIDHYWMGHEIPVPDPPGTEPEDTEIT